MHTLLRAANLCGALIFRDSITEIGSFAFKDCVSLEGIVVPDWVRVVGTGVFLWLRVFGLGCSSRICN